MKLISRTAVIVRNMHQSKRSTSGAATSPSRKQSNLPTLRPTRHPFTSLHFQFSQFAFRMSKSIVVGGSLGGLLTATALKRLGHTVTILERSPTPLLQDQGAGIVAGGETLKWLKKFDKSAREVAVVSPVRHYLDQKGKEIDVKEWEQKMTRHISLPQQPMASS